MSLFRPQAIAAQQAQWLGTVHLHRPWSSAVIVAAALTLAGSLVAFTVWGEVNRKAHIVGVLVPAQGSLNVQARDSGVITESRVVEGQMVKAGEILLVLGTERPSLGQGTSIPTSSAGAEVAKAIAARGQTLKAERSLREQQTRLREQALTERLQLMRGQAEQAAQERDWQLQKVRLAKTTMERQEALAQAGFVSAAQLQSRHEEQLDATGRLQSLERALLALASETAAVQGELRLLKTQLQSELAQIDRSIESAKQEAVENDTRRQAVVTAPFAGTVTAMHWQAGQAVQAGNNLMTLVAAGASPTANALQAHLYAPSRTVGFVQPGQSVYLRYDAYPYQKFGMHTGKVIAVSRTPFAANDLPANSAQQLASKIGTQEALFRITVALSSQTLQAMDQSWTLKPGLAVDADVMQERKKVWEWLFEPLLAVKQRVKVLSNSTAANNQKV